MTIYDMIKDHMTKSVPYAAHTGVELVEITAERATARLAKREAVGNHIQTVHAGAMFTLGETVSGAAMSGLLADDILTLRPVAAEASIRYVKTAKTDLFAIGRVDADGAAIKAALDADGKVQFDVKVDIKDADQLTVAEMTVAWHVTKTG